jgi:L-lysine exporter family protein LysE/ArgO
VIASADLATAIAGLAFGLSLIVAIGAQNAFVLRQGALREHVVTVVVICVLSDAILIAGGVAGEGAAVRAEPWLLTAVRIVGASLLLAYGALAGWRVVRQSRLELPSRAGGSSRLAVAGACLAFTWLNPAVYLDTVVVLGSVANAEAGRQWWFAGGATIASILWFTVLGFGAGLLGRVFERPGAWRALDGLVAVIMGATAVRILS